ncbi:MAG: hypothetical protein KGJ13_08065 [Patescibacteria group bacterium]|nr:hypothetical protein [Patescibacteria group bacterium]
MPRAKSITVSIREATATAGADVRVDREKGIIYGVKVVGRESPNRHGLDIEGTIYTPDALQRAIPMYEGANVNLNHPSRKDPTSDYPVESGIGQLRNCRLIDGELYADLHLLTKHPFADQLFEAAERMPTMFGLSHNSKGVGEIVNKKFVVREIPYVRCVDLVRDPGSVHGLFESRETEIFESAFDDLVDKLMKEGHSKESATKIAAYIGRNKIGASAMAKKAAAARTKESKRTLCEAMIEDLKIKEKDALAILESVGISAKCMEDDDGETPDEPTAKDHIGEAVRAVFHDDSLEDADKLKKIRKLVSAAADVEEDDGEGDGEGGEPAKKKKEDEPPMDTETKESLSPEEIQEFRTMKAENVRMKKERTVLALCESAQFKPGPRALQALMLLESEKEIKEAVQEFKAQARPASGPRTGQHVTTLESREMPAKSEDFAKALLR